MKTIDQLITDAKTSDKRNYNLIIVADKIKSMTESSQIDSELAYIYSQKILNVADIDDLHLYLYLYSKLINICNNNINIDLFHIIT